MPDLRDHERAYWLAAIELVTEELEKVTAAEFEDRKWKMVAILKNATYRLRRQ